MASPSRVGPLQSHEPTRPPNFDQIEAAIEESRAMLDLEENWAEQGSPRFQAATWQRARDFIERSVMRLWDVCRLTAPVPEIQPVGDGSIDIEWQNDKHNLLVNIPIDPNAPATFFGRDPERRYTIKGSLDTSTDNEWVLMWLLA